MTIFVQVNERTWLNPADIKQATWDYHRDDHGTPHWGLQLLAGAQHARICVAEKYAQATARALGVGIVAEPKSSGE